MSSSLIKALLTGMFNPSIIVGFLKDESKRYGVTVIKIMLGGLATLITIMLTSFIVIAIGTYRIITGSETLFGLLKSLYLVIFLIPTLWWIFDAILLILALWLTRVNFDLIDVINLRAFSLAPLLFKTTYIYVVYYKITFKLMVFSSMNITNLITSLWTPILSIFLIKKYFGISLLKAFVIGITPFLIKILMYLLI